jgi:hypothetical protein
MIIKTEVWCIVQKPEDIMQWVWKVCMKRHVCMKSHCMSTNHTSSLTQENIGVLLSIHVVQEGEGHGFIEL